MNWHFHFLSVVAAPHEVGDCDDLFESDHPGGYGGVVVAGGVAYTITTNGSESVVEIARRHFNEDGE